MPSIADLFISVSSDVSGAINGLTDVDQKVNGVSNSMQSAVPAGLALAGAATAVGAGFLDAISVAADFQQHMANVNALLDPSQVDTYSGALTNLALQLGKDTVFSADQAATAIGELIKAGVDVPTVLNGGAAAALNLAAATGTDIPTAAAFAGTALNTFHESADQLTHTVDVLTGVANSSAASIDSLKLGFAAVGPVAAAIGLSFDDTATALGVFANNGLAGSDAGTSLKTMLLNLEPSTNKQVAAMKELGIITADGTNQFFDASGQAKSMDQIFQILKNSTANLTAEQKTNLLQTAFGTDAVRAAAIAASEGADGFNKLSAQVQIEGLAAQEAAVRQNTLEGSLNQLGGSLETAKITIGDRFLPVLRTLTDLLTTVVNAFLTLPGPVQDALVAIVGIAGAVAGFLAAWILVGPMLTSVAAGFGVILGAILPILGPLALIAAAAALLYAAWQDDFGGIREVTQQVWEAIQPAFQNIQNFLGTLRDTFGPVFQSMTSSTGPFIEQLSAYLAPILAQLPQLVKDAGDEFNRLGDFFSKLSDVVRFLVGGDFGAFFNLLNEGVDPGFLEFLLNAKIAFDQIGPVVEMVAQAINFLITGNMDRLVELMQEGLPQPFAAALQFIHDVIVVQIQVWGDLLGGIKDFVGFLAAGDLQGAFNSLIATFGKIKDDILPLWNEFLSVLGGLLQALGPWIGDRVGDIWVGLNREWLALPYQLTAVWEAIKPAIADLIGQLPGVIGDRIGDLWIEMRKQWAALPYQLTAVWESIKPALTDLIAQLPGIIGGAVSDLWIEMRKEWAALPDQLTAVWEAIKPALGSLIAQLPGLVAGTAQGFSWDEFTSALHSGLNNAIFAAWNLIGNFAQTGLGQFLADVISAVENLSWDQFTSALQSGLNKAISAAWNLIGNFAQTGVGQAVGDMIQNIRDTIANSPNPWKGFIDSAWNIGTDIGAAFQNFMTFIKQEFDLIKNLVDWGALWKAFTDSVWNIGTDIGAAFQNFMTFIKQEFDLIKNLVDWGELWKAFTDSIWNIGNTIGEPIGHLFGWLGEQFSGLPETLKNAAGDLWKWFTDSIWNIGNNIGEPIGHLFGWLGEQFAGLPQFVLEHFGDLWKWFTDSIWNIGNDIGEPIGHLFGWLGEQFAGLPQFILEHSGDIFGGIITQAKALVDRLGEALEPIKQVLADTFGAFWTWLTTGTLPVPTSTGGSGGGTGGFGGDGTVPTGGTGPLVSIGTLIISSQEEADAFLNLVAQAVLASSRRVTVPTGGANPVL